MRYIMTLGDREFSPVLEYNPYIPLYVPHAMFNDIYFSCQKFILYVRQMEIFGFVSFFFIIIYYTFVAINQFLTCIYSFYIIKLLFKNKKIKKMYRCILFYLILCSPRCAFHFIEI